MVQVSFCPFCTLKKTRALFAKAAGGDADVAANQLLAERLIE